VAANPGPGGIGSAALVFKEGAAFALLRWPQPPATLGGTAGNRRKSERKTEDRGPHNEEEEHTVNTAIRRLGVGPLLLACAWAAAASAAPRAVVVGEAHLDLGKVEPGDVQHLTFQLRNDGDEMLQIQDAEPTCYCTSSKLDKWDLGPGDIATLQVRIDPSDFVGAVTKGVEISTNDPDNPTVLVDAELFVLPGIAVVPPEIDFGNVPAEGTKRSQQVDIKAPRDRDFEVESVTSEAAYLELDHEPLDLEDRTGAMVFVKVLPGAPSGDFKATVVVHTTDADRPTIEIPIHGRGAGGLRVEPARVTFAGKAAGEEVGSFTVHGADGIEATSSDASLLAEVEDLPDGGMRVVLRLASDARPGRLLAKVHVSSSKEKAEGLDVPVMGMVR